MAEQQVKTPAVIQPKKDKKWLVWGLIGFTGILLITAVILYGQLKKPTASPLPTPRPVASPEIPPIQEAGVADMVCELRFTVEASPSPSPSPTPSPPPSTCFDSCESDTDCVDELRCMSVSGEYRCVESDCPDEVDCVCPGESPSPSPPASEEPPSSPLPPGESLPPITKGGQPELPEAGVATPAVLGASIGILLVVLGLLF